MKRLLLVVACIVSAVAVANPVSAVTLTSSDLIGYVIDGAPSSPTDEVAYANQLISMYNADPNITGPIVVGTETFILSLGGNVPPEDLALLVLAGSLTIDPPVLPYDTSPDAYDYLLAKFGGYSALFWLGGETVIDGITLDPPAGVQGGGLSHFAFFNPTTRVPEAGALFMFGSGLIGLVGYRRVRRMQ